MKIPLSLIQAYLSIPESIAVLCETLINLGIEVDAVYGETPLFSGVVVAEILSSKPHPGANQLAIATVSDGQGKWQVVCGAANCRAGLKTAWAKPGAVLPGSIEIQEATIRGERSFGMLCSARELGVAEDPSAAEGIIELPETLSPGKDLIELFGDPVLELSLTPNLGHCLSALGIARELSAAWNRPLRCVEKKIKEKASSWKSKFVCFVANPEHCSRYCCRVIEGVKIGPSPFWLKNVLLSVGWRPINNVVDIANFMMLKTGQPFHVFDAEKIHDQTIRVELLTSTQPFLGLDDIQRKIGPGVLAVCDGMKPIAIAGVLGEKTSAVSNQTHTLLVEAACFNPAIVRKATREYCIHTESSYRFARGVDSSQTLHFLEELCEQIVLVAGGQILEGAIDIVGIGESVQHITLRQSRVGRLLGLTLSLGEIQELLERAACKILKLQDLTELSVQPPAYRKDLTTEIELIEEIARLYGYQNIPKRTPLATTSAIGNDPYYQFEKEIRSTMVRLGLQEFLNCDLVSPQALERVPELYPTAKLLRVAHAKSEEYSILRPSLMIGMLASLKHNLDQQTTACHAFEIGKAYTLNHQEPIATLMLGMILTGQAKPAYWQKQDRQVDFYDLKGKLETLLQDLKIQRAEFRSSKHPSFHPGRQAELYIGECLIGSLGEVHPHVLGMWGIDQSVVFGEWNLQYLFELKPALDGMTPLPQFPGTERDWTLDISKGLSCAKLLQTIEMCAPSLLKKVEVIDLYEKRNLTIRFTYRDFSRTLSFADAEGAHSQLITDVIRELQL